MRKTLGMLSEAIRAAKTEMERAGTDQARQAAADYMMETLDSIVRLHGLDALDMVIKMPLARLDTLQRASGTGNN